MCNWFGYLLFISNFFIPVTISESKLEKAKVEAKEVLAKQVKVSLEFQIEQVGVQLSFVSCWGSTILNGFLIPIFSTSSDLC